jgi:hypothetical protein
MQVAPDLEGKQSAPAAAGQLRMYRLLECLPVSGHSPHAASAKEHRVAKRRAIGRKLRGQMPGRILSARSKIVWGQGMSEEAPEQGRATD